MKLGPLSDTRVAGSSKGVSNAGPNKAASTSGAASTPSAAPSAGVPVTVSNQALAMEQSKGPDIDMAKVASVRTAIANGTFKVNPEAIADKLIANAREMLKRNDH